MGWFGKQLLKVIEWKDDTQNVMVYRFPMEDREIMSGSKLTVRESQMAVFVHKGQIADVFGPGLHNLVTRNLPFLTKIASMFYNFESKFKAEVYFVNTKQFINKKWGTTNPIPMRDKEFGVVRLRGYGVYGFKVGDPAVFLKTLFGTNSVYTVDGVSDYLKSILVSSITDTIAESKVSALDLASNLTEFNQLCVEHTQHKFDELGLTLTSLTIENLSFPESVEKALDERSTLGILGDKMNVYAQKKAADAMLDAANNTGTAGSVFGMNIGQGLGNALGGAFNGGQQQQQSNAASVAPQEKSKFCAECGAKLSASAKFCPECGKKL